VKPAAFRYHAARSVEQALELLASTDGEAKLLAGGQSLVPMMNFRLVRPAHLIDLNGVGELAGTSARNGDLVLGAMTRQADAERDPLVRERAPLLAEALPLIGHPAIRNRGTVGGSLAHADPAAELPVVALALDARLRIRGPAGAREVTADEFFVALLTTALAPDEILTEVVLGPWRPTWGWAFGEFARRHGDFAIVSVAVVAALESGRLAQPLRIVLGGVGDRPVRAGEAERLLAGETPTGDVLDAAARAAVVALDPPSDVHGSSEYRRDVARVYTRRALDAAIARARAA
jgi:aerobic carbon-monoxide dehydrogenase medium subunit